MPPRGYPPEELRRNILLRPVVALSGGAIPRRRVALFLAIRDAAPPERAFFGAAAFNAENPRIPPARRAGHFSLYFLNF